MKKPPVVSDRTPATDLAPAAGEAGLAYLALPAPQPPSASFMAAGVLPPAPVPQETSSVVMVDLFDSDLDAPLLDILGD